MSYPPAPKTVEQSIQWMSDPARGNGWKGLCLKAARSSYGLPGGVPDADAAGDQAAAAGRMRTDRNPPRGAAVFWTIAPHDHVGIAVGDGTFWGTDLPTSDRIGLAKLTDPETRWGARWRGWSDLLNGHLLPLSGPSPAPTPPDGEDMFLIVRNKETGGIYLTAPGHIHPLTSAEWGTWQNLGYTYIDMDPAPLQTVLTSLTPPGITV